MMTIQQALETIHQQIQTSTQLAHRPESAVTLLAVSKTKKPIKPDKKHLGRTMFKKVSIKFSILKHRIFNLNGILLGHCNLIKPVLWQNISIGCKR